MINTDILQMFPYVKNTIYNLEVVRDCILEENAICKLLKKEVNDLLEFISVLSTEYIRIKTKNENYSKQVVENG